MYDPGIGRFFAVDPLTSSYPHYSPYSFSGNKVIAHRELEGLEEMYYLDSWMSETAKTLIDNGDYETIWMWIEQGWYEKQEGSIWSQRGNILLYNSDPNISLPLIGVIPKRETFQNNLFQAAEMIIGSGIKDFVTPEPHWYDPGRGPLHDYVPSEAYFESLVKSVNLGVSGKIKVGTSVVEYRIGLYSNSEWSGGYYSNLNVYSSPEVKVDLSNPKELLSEFKKRISTNITEFIPKAEATIGLGLNFKKRFYPGESYFDTSTSSEVKLNVRGFYGKFSPESWEFGFSTSKKSSISLKGKHKTTIFNYTSGSVYLGGN